MGDAGPAEPRAGRAHAALAPGPGRRLEPGEEEKVLAGCDAAGQAVLRPIVIWALETAMRQGEISRSKPGAFAAMSRTCATPRPPAPGRCRFRRAPRVLDERPVPLRGPLFPITQDSLEYFWRKALRIAGSKACAFTIFGTRRPRACSSAALTHGSHDDHRAQRGHAQALYAFPGGGPRGEAGLSFAAKIPWPFSVTGSLAARCFREHCG